ncbi:MAG: hypothetical protein HQL95_16330 [Magnetococcales bacterium]|nr:hypothetical protein [Magnetococcales bacterium]
MTGQEQPNPSPSKVAETGDETSGAAPLPTALQRPLVDSLTRMLAGRGREEEILDPANPNLIMDRDR